MSEGIEIEFKPVSDETMKLLMALPKELRHSIVPAALEEIGQEWLAQSHALLSGPQDNVGKGTDKRSRSPGQYPVNVVTGHLRRSLRMVNPGRLGLSLHQVAVADTAGYAAVIHEGRPFIEDGLRAVLVGEIIADKIEEAA